MGAFSNGSMSSTDGWIYRTSMWYRLYGPVVRGIDNSAMDKVSCKIHYVQIY